MDYATYSPTSLVLRRFGWLEAARTSSRARSGRRWS